MSPPPVPRASPAPPSPAAPSHAPSSLSPSSSRLYPLRLPPDAPRPPLPLLAPAAASVLPLPRCSCSPLLPPPPRFPAPPPLCVLPVFQRCPRLLAPRSGLPGAGPVPRPSLVRALLLPVFSGPPSAVIGQCYWLAPPQKACESSCDNSTAPKSNQT
ncbi:unnamed protein product [Dicrocoelium dendriticum]|nr:unnamed protein product [Dicrocoelium dendriticum]